MKKYHELKYKHTQRVAVTIITLGEIETFFDEIKGLNKGHALYLAKKLNWPWALKIEAID